MNIMNVAKAFPGRGYRNGYFDGGRQGRHSVCTGVSSPEQLRGRLPLCKLEKCPFRSRLASLNMLNHASLPDLLRGGSQTFQSIIFEVDLVLMWFTEFLEFI